MDANRWGEWPALQAALSHDIIAWWLRAIRHDFAGMPNNRGTGEMAGYDVGLGQS